MSLRNKPYVIVKSRMGQPLADVTGWERQRVLDAIVRAGAAGVSQEDLAHLCVTAWSKTPNAHAVALQNEGLAVLKEGRWYSTRLSSGESS